jgi:hypothetical protein
MAVCSSETEPSRPSKLETYAGSQLAEFHVIRSCTRTPSNASTPEPEARAECGISARSDPWGGSPNPLTLTGKGCPYRNRNT